MKPDMLALVPQLRLIGFGSWDPLGLSETWVEGEPMADEYDSYLISAFRKATKLADIGAVCEVLHEAEAKMGLVSYGSIDCRERAAREILELARRNPF